MAENVYDNIEKNPPDLDIINVQIVVMGEASCGKTSFIRAFYNNHSPEEMYSDNGVRVYRCKFKFNNKQLIVVFFEIPSDPGFLLEHKVAHYLHATICVFMYAFDNPSSVDMLIYRWIPESLDIVDSRPRLVVLMGNKKDLKNDPHVLERLIDENETPISQRISQLSREFDCNTICGECCSHDVENVKEVFNHIFQFCIDN